MKTRFSRRSVLDDRLDLPRDARAVLVEARQADLSLAQYHTVLREQITVRSVKYRDIQSDLRGKANTARRLMNLEESLGKKFVYDARANSIYLTGTSEETQDVSA